MADRPDGGVEPDPVGPTRRCPGQMPRDPLTMIMGMASGSMFRPMTRVSIDGVIDAYSGPEPSHHPDDEFEGAAADG